MLRQIRGRHILIEGFLQQIGSCISQSECASCLAICCDEKYCRESTDSSFLRYILGTQAQEYDPIVGWHRNDTGCTLKYGRPFVCYEYFCSRFRDTSGVSNLGNLARLFRQCYAKALGSRHILAVDKLQDISAGKLATILFKLERVEELARAALQGTRRQT
ncbi:MAG: hypothetical protein ACLPXB_19140 [Thiobacillaceae bacterium]